MPTLELVSRQQAQLELSLSGKRGAMMRQYMEYINQLESDGAGRLTPDEGETTAALRRRLGTAAKLLGKNIVTARQGTWSSSGRRVTVPRRVGEEDAARPAPSSAGAGTFAGKQTSA